MKIFCIKIEFYNSVTGTFLFNKCPTMEQLVKSLKDKDLYRFANFAGHCVINETGFYYQSKGVGEISGSYQNVEEL